MRPNSTFLAGAASNRSAIEAPEQLYANWWILAGGRFPLAHAEGGVYIRQADSHFPVVISSTATQAVFTS
jgi:hypothetical protein